MDRGTVQVLEGGTLTVTGGTFIGINQQAVSNEGTLIIGVEDGILDNTTPVFQGATYGIKSSVPFEFYNGIAKGLTGGISGTVSAMEQNSRLATGTETIGSDTYHTAYLENAE